MKKRYVSPESAILEFRVAALYTGSLTEPTFTPNGSTDNGYADAPRRRRSDDLDEEEEEEDW